ncbi:MAG: flagellar M-ring protein FliF [Verrucomicrobia bacterium CG_4_10_14_3_um_filter_43_23]|nr:MAG: flagellar M-ring protein FliF [Verrucomicrobia bacterium CG1_02_43_26]PIP58813.1 MAG: flagellar M-ring protein FliF [Verrucomicrobia bacterium CG22_combo_CG10-13_8_21_14_all_43_17]PIX58292.1 MAG: flagellar M-ring protein FliF [Verrucomicrobia bacterium CG_4_10_14_3_um_filter_43_23]PIY62008.1 MAG: flagellar M-ring protein FliF [Verrucomicrobia bacterium CG_4_10_14_0_8_um_filter_43_34]PJA44014.1 MAG: flagellar M-ring protein FliF [Verrucomicrobia bacterium CG_4_9_14_3_um_filter_43_20]
MKTYLIQLQSVWKDFTLGQKLSIFLAVGIVFVGIAGMVIWSGKQQMQLLYGKLDNTDMAEVVKTIEEKSIKYKIGAGGSSIFVPSDQIYKLRMDLAVKGVPSGGSVGYEIFDKPNFGISDFIQRTNYLRAIQGELGRTISQLRGIRSARVMVTVPENKLLAEQANTRATASVFVETGGYLLPEESVNSIRFLVANSVEGLDVNNVAVVDNNGNVLSEQLKNDGSLSVVTGQLRYRKTLEDYFSKKVETMLTKVVGPGGVVAKVSVSLNSDATKITEEKFDPEGQVARTLSTTEDTSTSSETQTNVIAGATATLAGENTASSTEPVNSSQSVRKNKTTAYEINKSIYETVKVPGSISHLSASVFVAMREEIGGKTGGFNPKPRTAEEIEAMRQIVINTLGITAENAKNVTIQEMPFVRSEVLKGPDPMGIPEPVRRWAEFLRGYGAIGIAILMFVVFLRMLKKHKPQMSTLELMDERRRTENTIAKSKDSNMRPTADLINDLIQEKPQNVSAALQNWITSTQTK